MTTPVPVVLDVDTGVDDALALLLALRSPALDLRAVTCVAGNVAVDQVVRNTLTVLEVAGAPPVPVARGAAHPVGGQPVTTRSVHGADGMADLGLPEPGRRAVAADAVELMRTTLSTADRPVTLVCLAPPTNLAQLLATHPHLMGSIGRVVMVGGFNRTHDPRAWDAVLRSGLPVTTYDMEVFALVTVERTRAMQLAAADAPVSRLAGRLLLHQSNRKDGGPAGVGDAGLVAAVIKPDGLSARPEPGLSGVSVATEVDAVGFAALLLESVSADPPDAPGAR